MVLTLLFCIVLEFKHLWTQFVASIFLPILVCLDAFHVLEQFFFICLRMIWRRTWKWSFLESFSFFLFLLIKMLSYSIHLSMLHMLIPEKKKIITVHYFTSWLIFFLLHFSLVFLIFLMMIECFRLSIPISWGLE